jgi:hypothetical protein
VTAPSTAGPQVGTVVGVHVWPEAAAIPEPRDFLDLDFGGPVGDRHHGLTMASDVRQRWLYPQGTKIRNNRQVSIVDLGELSAVAAALGLPEIASGTIADNICTSGIDALSELAPLSRLVFIDADGAPGPVIAVLGRNNPCTIAGGLVEQRYGTPPERFPKAAMNRRGVTGWVERPGRVRAGDLVQVMAARPSG